MREPCSKSQLPRPLVPRQKIEPMLSNAVQQRLLDCVLIRGRIRAARDPDCAKAAASYRSDGSGCRIERSIVTCFDQIAEQLEKIALIDRRCTKNACARRAACDLSDGQPFAPSQLR